MESFYFLIPIAIVFCAIAIGAFFWAIDRGQFDDLDNEGKRILFDEDAPSPALPRTPLPQGEGLMKSATTAHESVPPYSSRAPLQGEEEPAESTCVGCNPSPRGRGVRGSAGEGR